MESGVVADFPVAIPDLFDDRRDFGRFSGPGEGERSFDQGDAVKSLVGSGKNLSLTGSSDEGIKEVGTAQEVACNPFETVAHFRYLFDLIEDFPGLDGIESHLVHACNLPGAKPAKH